MVRSPPDGFVVFVVPGLVVVVPSFDGSVGSAIVLLVISFCGNSSPGVVSFVGSFSEGEFPPSTFAVFSTILFCSSCVKACASLLPFKYKVTPVTADARERWQ